MRSREKRSGGSLLLAGLLASVACLAPQEEPEPEPPPTERPEPAWWRGDLWHQVQDELEDELVLEHYEATWYCVAGRTDEPVEGPAELLWERRLFKPGHEATPTPQRSHILGLRDGVLYLGIGSRLLFLGAVDGATVYSSQAHPGSFVTSFGILGPPGYLVAAGTVGIVVIDTANGQIRARLHRDDLAERIALNMPPIMTSDGQILVLARDAVVYRYDVDLDLTGNLPIGGGYPGDWVRDPERDLYYIMAGGLHAVDLNAGILWSTSGGGPWVTHTAGEEVVLWMNGANALHLHTPSTDQKERFWPPEGPDGESVYAGTFAGRGAPLSDGSFVVPLIETTYPGVEGISSRYHRSALWAFDALGMHRWIFYPSRPAEVLEEAMVSALESLVSQDSRFNLHWGIRDLVVGPDDTIYVASRDCSVRAFDPMGELLWRYRTPHPPEDLILGDDGVLYVVTEADPVLLDCEDAPCSADDRDMPLPIQRSPYGFGMAVFALQATASEAD